MLRWGYLAYLSADSVEAVNGDNTLYFQHGSQRGGDAGRPHKDGSEGGTRHTAMIEGCVSCLLRFHHKSD